MATEMNQQTSMDYKYQLSQSHALRCGECRTPVSPWGFIGFCAECGRPLCQNCVTMDHKVTSVLEASIVPLIVVNRFRLKTMDTAVTLGRKCKAR
jgi:predicted amidophosphoribosyltransferase